MEIRKEFTGMLPAVIGKFEDLLALPGVAALNPVVVKGYDHTAGQDSFSFWGAACRITVAVAPRAGAWIETCQRHGPYPCSGSRPARARGLKRGRGCRFGTTLRRAPRGRVD